MSTICQCPAAAAIPDVPNVQCSESFGQIQKVAFMRLRKADGTLNSFVTGDSTAITKKAAWDAKISAVDGGKIVVTPYLNAPADSGGDVRQTSGGNDDLGGVPTVLGANPVQFAAVMRGIPQTVAKALKQLICEGNSHNLGVFLFDENGKIEAIQDTATETTYYPIPIDAFFVGDKIHGNYDAKDSNAIAWYYREGYSDNLKIIVPEDFNPLVDLVNAENS